MGGSSIKLTTLKHLMNGFCSSLHFTGYIAGSRAFIEHVRATSAGFLVDTAMSPIVCQQILTAFKVLKGK